MQTMRTVITTPRAPHPRKKEQNIEHKMDTRNSDKLATDKSKFAADGWVNVKSSRKARPRKDKEEDKSKKQAPTTNIFDKPIEVQLRNLGQVNITGSRNRYHTYFDVTIKLPPHKKPLDKLMKMISCGRIFGPSIQKQPGTPSKIPVSTFRASRKVIHYKRHVHQ
jgi:hypothetical protein